MKCPKCGSNINPRTLTEILQEIPDDKLSMATNPNGTGEVDGLSDRERGMIGYGLVKLCENHNNQDVLEAAILQVVNDRLTAERKRILRELPKERFYRDDSERYETHIWNSCLALCVKAVKGK
jgi:hypothetical protein